MITDVKVGDNVRYSYKVYGVQTLSWGTVNEILENGNYILISGNKEVEVPAKSVVERGLREDERKPKVQAVPKLEDPLNSGITGVRFKRRKPHDKKN